MVPQTDNPSLLALWGWNDYFERLYRVRLAEEPKAAEWVRARVIGEERGFYRVQLAEGRVVWGEINPKIRREATGRRGYPAVGDWVMGPWQGGQDRIVINEFLERRSCLTRKVAGETTEEQVLATNVDVAFVMTSANDELNLRRLERYLALVVEGGAMPVVLLSKSDLATDTAPLVTAIETLGIGQCEVIAISVRSGLGLDRVLNYLTQGTTTVLLGSSGVGKSTLANHLMGSNLQKTQEVSEHQDKGKHTTTTRNLMRLASGALLVDTPGMRELHLTGEHSEGIDAVFSDVDNIAATCKFANCEHATEPKCAIKAALAAGSLSEVRYASYLKLRREIAVAKSKSEIVKKPGKPKKPPSFDGN